MCECFIGSTCDSFQELLVRVSTEVVMTILVRGFFLQVICLRQHRVGV